MKTRTRLISVLAAAAIGMTTLPVTAGGERAEVIAEWNQLLQSNIPSTAGLLTPRYYAMLHVAMFDAANAIEQRYTPYHARLHAHPGRFVRGSRRSGRTRCTGRAGSDAGSEGALRHGAAGPARENSTVARSRGSSGR